MLVEVEELLAEQHMTRLRRALDVVVLAVFAADSVVLSLSIWLGWQLRSHFGFWASDLNQAAYRLSTVGTIFLALWLATLVLTGSYSARLFGDGPEEFRVVVRATLFAAGAVGMVSYLGHVLVSRGFVLLTFVIGGPLLLLSRYVARKVLRGLRRRGRLRHRALVVGEPLGINELVGVLQRDAGAGYEIVGSCLSGAGEETPAAPVLGSVAGLLNVCREYQIDTVLVARGFETSEMMRDVTWELEDTQIDLIVVPSISNIARPRIQMRPVSGLPLVHVERPTTRLAGGWPKRTFDLVLSVLGLVVISPLLGVIALTIWLQDRGPVLYRQERIGRGGAPFSILKFRSMYVDAEKREAELRAADDHAGALWKSERDPRVTPIGRFLRRYSLDELPQLFNVVRGDMSLVGPRPQQQWEVDTYAPHMHRRHAVRPGMTGLWQVSGRSDLSWDDAVRLDNYYVDNWSMVVDLGILLRTLRAVLAGSGAY